MKSARRLFGLFTSLVLGVSLLAGLRLGAVDNLSWKPNSVAAEVSSWDLPKLLQKLAEVTGWQIYVDPEAKQVTSTKFKDRSQGEALRLLLGDLNFALLPAQSNGPPRLFVFRTTMQEATQLVKLPAKPKAKAIPNELVVRVKPGVNIDELAKKVGAKVIGRADKFNTYRLQFADADAANRARATLEENSDIDSIQNNFEISRPASPDSLTLSSSAPIDLKPRASADGSHLIIGLIDTAIQRQGTGIEDFLLPGLAVGDEGKPPGDEPTHGTSMTETMLRALSIALQGGDSSARILPVDVYGNSPTTSTFDVAMGIYKAVNNGAQIINLSLGSDASSPFLAQMIQSSHDQGVLFFAAAGNEPVATPTYPAAYPEVIAVTAGTRQGVIAPYANYGSFVDVIAPGTAIVNFNGQSWLVTGTSASTAYASGAAAALLEKDGKLSAAEIEARIRAIFGQRRQ